MNPILFTIAGISIRWYSVLLLIAIILGFILIEYEGKKYEYPKDFLFNLVFWVVIIGFISARLYYVLFNYKMYINDPISIFKIWEGGLAIHGGLIGGFLTLLFYCKRYNANVLKVTDMATIPLLLGQAIGRWGNFFNSEAHGSATSLLELQNYHIPKFIIEGMHINGIYYHPTFFYESIWCLLGVFLLLVVRHYRYLKVGELTCIYLMWYSFGRFFIEALRTDSLMFSGFKVAQIVSITLFIIGLIMLLFIKRKSKFESLYHNTGGSNIKY